LRSLNNLHCVHKNSGLIEQSAAYGKHAVFIMLVKVDEKIRTLGDQLP
jgi:hypothetical protein